MARYPLPVRRRAFSAPILLLLSGNFFAVSRAAPPVVPGPLPGGEIQLPNGRLLTPAGRQTEVLPYPFALALTPGGGRLLAASTGSNDQALQLLDAADGRLLFSAPVQKSWLGLALSPDGRRAYLSGANSNAVLVYRIGADRLDLEEEIPVSSPSDGMRDPLPAGLAVSPDGRSLWVARVLAGDLVRIDLESKKVTASVPAGKNPYRPVFSPDGRTIAVASWGGATVTLVDAAAATAVKTVATDDHPCDLAFARDGKLLFVAQANRNRVAVVDLEGGKVGRQISVAFGPDGPGTPSAEALPDGSTPNALALSPDGRTLYVANADDDAVAVVDLSGGAAAARAKGFIPVGWYPAALALTPDGRTLFVANGKGSGSRANAADGPNPLVPKRGGKSPGSIRNIPGSVSRIAVPTAAGLARHTARAYANRKPAARGASPARSTSVVPDRGDASPIRHVLYVIRENRTYDQVFGDLPRGNGDPSLAIFGREVTPNAHALAEEFVLFDNFYADAEVSADGHNWSMAAYATDFTEKTWVAEYGDRGFTYVYEGGDPVAAPSAGYLWDAAARKGLSLRNYGEFVDVAPEKEAVVFDGRFEGQGPNLKGNTCPFYPGFDGEILDNARVDLWLKEFHAYEKKGDLPRLMIVRLGNDHTMGTKKGQKTPRAMVADNDLALGRLVAAVSRSKFWKETAVFVVEDDAQNGSDHVDAHRTVALVVSPYTRRAAVDSTLYSTTSMLKTMEMILGLPPMSQHDDAATPMTNAFSEEPDPRPWSHRPAGLPLYEMNPDGAPMQAEMEGWDFTREDAAPEIALNEAIWKSVRGAGAEMPAPVNAAFVRAR